MAHLLIRPSIPSTAPSVTCAEVSPCLDNFIDLTQPAPVLTQRESFPVTRLRMSASRRSSSQCPSPPILPALLELHRRGKPPFLVRNLRYVRDDRQRARRRLWDISWTRPSYRSASGARHLLLTVRPSRCVLRAGIRGRLFRTRVFEPSEYVPLTAAIRLCLCVRQEGGHYVSFSLRELSVRVWPAEDLAAGLVEPCDVAVRETFDISAVLPVLSSDAEALSLVVELAPVMNDASSASRTCDKLRGELVLWEKGSANGTVVPNGFVTLPLYIVNDSAIQPKHVVLERAVRQSSASFASSEGDVPFVGAGAASVVLQLEGAPQHSISKAVQRHKPNLMITLAYTSQQVPHWNGIIRHDFVCPWCHRNCYRYRTLLSHFQMEHEHMKFQLTSLKSQKPESDDVNSTAVSRNETVPFLVRFSVERMDPQSATTPDPFPSSIPKRLRSGEGTVQLPEQIIYANPQRYGSYIANNSTRADEQVREAMERVSLRDNALSSDVQSLASTELYDNARRDLLSTVQEELSKCCKHCQRPHDFAYKANTDFCSEWCEAIYTVNRDEDGVSLRGNRRYFPLTSYSSYNSRKRFDFRRSLGHRKLFHVVSMTPVKEEHYDEDDPDSEDEVDQSWRGRLAIERAMYLENTTTTETLFMVMWNKFAHENFPLPSLYGDRFTRYTLELFAIENRAHIIRLKLRLKFLAFLRVLHMHGLIDSVAVLSIFQCLDGKKKRRDIALSSRPERSVPGNNGRGSRTRRVGART